MTSEGETVAERFVTNRIKRGKRTSSASVEDIKARLVWMAENPGLWLHWGRSGWGAKDLRPPAFDRVVISPSMREFDHLPGSSLAPGLWLRYRGIEIFTQDNDELVEEVTR